MSCTDHADVHVLDTIQSLEHKRFEWSDDTVIVILQCLLIILLVSDLRGDDFRQAVVGTKRVTGHQDLLFLDKRIHGVRPVQIRHKQEMERSVTDGHLLVVTHRNADEIPVYDLF